MQKKVPALNLVTLIQPLVASPVVRRRLARLAAWVAGALGVVIVAAMAVVHFWILPRINDFRPWLEQRASSTLGLKVHIREIAVLRQGLQPAIELRGLRFLDEEGNEGLHVRAIEAEASLLSLLRGRFARLAVCSPRCVPGAWQMGAYTWRAWPCRRGRQSPQQKMPEPMSR